MRPPRIGALFAGYSGLEMGVQSVLGGELAWYSEIDKGALKILTHHHPDVPNVGDITTVDWSQVDPVDILTGGSPCQDLSHAGKRAGMTEGTRSNLWVAMREAIAQLRPRLVVWENVRGAASAEADSDLEFCAGCMGEAWYRGPSLRALGRVVGDLADIGYVGGIHGLRAADVGACHGRFRFILAAHPEGNPWGFGNGNGSPTPNARRLRSGARRKSAPGQEDRGWAQSVPSVGSGVGPDGTLLPTPRATDGTKGGPNQRGSSGDLMLPSAVALLPTPAAQEPGGTLEQYHARLKAADGRDSTFAPLSMAVQLLPTPSVADVQGGRKARSGDRNDEPLLNGIAHADLWGDYADGIARWEHVTGRPAPAPTMTSTKGNPQLAPVFVEWMMGLPAGHVTDAPGITRNEALKALGNGVVPQQAEAALRFLLGALEVAA